VHAIKSITQPYTPSENVLNLMHKFVDGINLCINIALKNNLTSRFSLSREAYPLLIKYGIPSYYYPEIINKALALVKSYRKRLRKKKHAKEPRVEKLMLSTYYGFKITGDDLLIPVANEKYGRKYERITLNSYVKKYTYEDTFIYDH